MSNPALNLCITLRIGGRRARWMDAEVRYRDAFLWNVSSCEELCLCGLADARDVCRTRKPVQHMRSEEARRMERRHVAGKCCADGVHVVARHNRRARR